MKRRLLALCLIAAMTFSMVGGALAEEQNETWFVEEYIFNGTSFQAWQVGMEETSLVLKSDGTGSVNLMGEPVSMIEWTEDEICVTIIADGKEDTLLKDGDRLMIEDDLGKIVFGRVKPSVTGYIPAQARADVPMEAFSGMWKGILMINGDQKIPAGGIGVNLQIDLENGTGWIVRSVFMKTEMLDVQGRVEERTLTAGETPVSVLILQDETDREDSFLLLEDDMLVWQNAFLGADVYLSRDMLVSDEVVAVVEISEE